MKFQASSHLLWLYSPVCVDLVGNLEDDFSRDTAQMRISRSASFPSTFSALGKTWNGLEWNGMEWIGLDWNGMEWNGMERYSIMSS